MERRPFQLIKGRAAPRPAALVAPLSLTIGESVSLLRQAVAASLYLAAEKEESPEVAARLRTIAAEFEAAAAD